MTSSTEIPDHFVCNWHFEFCNGRPRRPTNDADWSSYNPLAWAALCWWGPLFVPKWQLSWQNSSDYLHGFVQNERHSHRSGCIVVPMPRRSQRRSMATLTQHPFVCSAVQHGKDITEISLLLFQTKWSLVQNIIVQAYGIGILEEWIDEENAYIIHIFILSSFSSSSSCDWLLIASSFVLTVE